jgi:hypothetical protein
VRVQDIGAVEGAIRKPTTPRKAGLCTRCAALLAKPIGPSRVAEYTETTYKVSENIFTIYYFRVGYAAFTLALIQGFPEYILADLDFQDGDEAFEELRPAAI